MSCKRMWQQCDIQPCGVRQPHSVFIIHTDVVNGLLWTGACENATLHSVF